ncbi:MAG: C1q-like domain-containing protein [Spirosomataceae bacterium]
MKITFTISLFLLSLTTLSQVTQTSNLLKIGNQTSSGHSLLVGLPSATEIGRLQTTTPGNYPFLRLNNGNYVFGVSLFPSTQPYFDFNVDYGVNSRIVFENATTGANSFVFGSSIFNNESQQELQALQGIKAKMNLNLNGTAGQVGQIVTSRGSGLSPVWATTHDDPKQGINAYLDYTLTLNHNTSETLSNFTILNEDVAPYLQDGFDESTGNFTARQAGLYHFDLYITDFQVASNKADMLIWLFKNGTTQFQVKKDFGKYGATTSMENEAHLSQNIYLQSGDIVHFSITQSNIDSLPLSITPELHDKKIRLGIYQIYSY